jgi:hypothetical protein
MATNYQKRKATFPGLTILLVATSCQLGVPVQIDVRDAGDVRFSIPDEHVADFCLNSATIYRVTPETESPVWRIELLPQDGAPCVTTFAFPETPPNFVAEIKSSSLRPGSYRVEIDGGLPSASGRFVIPSGTEERQLFAQSKRSTGNAGQLNQPP